MLEVMHCEAYGDDCAGDCGCDSAAGDDCDDRGSYRWKRLNRQMTDARLDCTGTLVTSQSALWFV